MGSSHGNSQGDYLAFSSTVWHRRQRQSGSSDVYRRHLGHRDRGVGIAATLYELSSRIMPPSRLMRKFPVLVTASDGKSRGRELVKVVREAIMSSVSWEQVEVGSS